MDGHEAHPRRILAPGAPSGHQIRGARVDGRPHVSKEPRAVPGSTEGQNTYNGDIINTRLIIEYIADDKRGLAFDLELLSVHGLSHRLDGHDLNLNPKSFSLIGVEPSVQYNIFYDNTGGLVAAAGCLFSIAGQNDLYAVYPNVSMYYYWNPKGQPIMR